MYLFIDNDNDDLKKKHYQNQRIYRIFVMCAEKKILPHPHNCESVVIAFILY